MSRYKLRSTIALCLTAGCGTSAPGSDPTTRADSAGVEIVRNDASLAETNVVDFVGVGGVDIGGILEDPVQELASRLSHDFLRLSNGDIAVSDGYDLHFYSWNGEFQGALGRKGEGPGEFQSSIWTLCEIRPDTLLALEVPSPRFGIISGSRDSISTSTYSGQAISRGCVPDGFIARISPPSYDSAGPPTAEYAVIAGNGSILRLLGRLPSENHRTFFSREASIAGGPDGGITAGDGMSHEYRQYTSSGVLRRIVRTSGSVDTLTEAAAREIVAARLGRTIPRARAAALADEAIGSSPSLEVPAYQRLNVDENGRVWLAQLRLQRKDLERWVVFDSTGTLLGHADPNQIPGLPEGWKLLLKWTSKEAILGYTDGDGAFHVRAVPYRILQPDSGQRVNGPN